MILQSKTIVRFSPNTFPPEILLMGSTLLVFLRAKYSRRCGDDLTRGNIIKQALNLRNYSPSMAIPGIVINTGADNHQAWTSLQLQSFDGKSWVRFGKLINA